MMIESTSSRALDFGSFCESIASLCEVPVGCLGADSTLRGDLGFDDSIRVLELWVFLETLAMTEIPADLVASIDTLGEAYEWIKVKASQAHRSDATGIGRSFMTQMPVRTQSETLRANESPRVRSRRVELRLNRPNDLEWLYQAALHPRQGWRWRYRGSVPSRESFAAFLYEGVTCQFAIETLTSGHPCGQVSLYDVHAQGHGKLAVLKHLDAPASGLVIEGVALFVDYVFRVFSLRKLYMQTPEYAYQGLTSRVGKYFTEEGRFSEHEYYANRYWDLVTIAVSRDQWSELSAQLSFLRPD